MDIILIGNVYLSHSQLEEYQSMSLSPLYRFGTAKLQHKFKNYSKSTLFWLICSLLFAAYYGFCRLAQAFQSEYVVQDDARVYVFWMQRFIDSQLFTNDLIANYFQSITPLGYTKFYQLMANFGITPLLVSKFLPICLGLITTIYTFVLSLRLFPVKITAFFSTLLLNQTLWFYTEISAAAPRSFIYPLLPALLYYFLRKSWLAIAIIMILQALFYPLLVFLYSGILIIHWRQQVRQLLIIFVLTLTAMSPYIISASQYGPVVSYTQAWHMPEHWVGGRHHFFDPNALYFWLIGDHSGILPSIMPYWIWVCLLLPWLRKQSQSFPLIRLLKSQDIQRLLRMILVAFSLYFAAHILFLKLFLPTRHTIHLLRVLMAIFSGITITTIGKRLISIYQDFNNSNQTYNKSIKSKQNYSKN
jgi:hypothetical protein